MLLEGGLSRRGQRWRLTYDVEADAVEAAIIKVKIATVNFILMFSDLCRERSVLRTEEEVRYLISLE